METRLQHLFLKRKVIGKVISKVINSALTALLISLLPGTSAAQTPAIDTELFELGALAGTLNIEDFTTEMSLGLYASFRATENFFLQTNYLQTDVSYSSVERGPLGPYTGDRNYRHFNLLLGYNLFQGEVFKGKYAGLSALYLVGGIGDTEFMDESNFTYVYGLGYQMSLSRRYTLRFDIQNYQYDTNVIDQQENTITNTHLMVGLSWQF